jgi:hypothetical protein
MASAKNQDPQELQEPQEPQAPQIVEEVSEFPLSLEEFCTRASVADRRVELLNAFAKSEIAAGNRKDVQSAFERRYVAFANQPA